MSQSNVMYSVLQNFVLGGTIIASVSYLATFMDPILGAIWWSFPISLLPTLYFMKHHGKSNKYIADFTVSTTYALILLVLSTGCLAYFIKNTKDSITMPVIKTTGVWLVASVVFYFAVHTFKLDKYFM